MSFLRTLANIFSYIQPDLSTNPCKKLNRSVLTDSCGKGANNSTTCPTVSSWPAFHLRTHVNIFSHHNPDLYTNPHSNRSILTDSCRSPAKYSTMCPPSSSQPAKITPEENMQSQTLTNYLRMNGSLTTILMYLTNSHVISFHF